MKKKLFILFFVSLSVLTGNLSAQTTKVLFLGNSYTYTHNIPGIFDMLATSAGMNIYIDSYSASGIAVADEQVPGHINDPISQAKINSQPWDYIIVQDNQGDYINNVGVIPAAAGNANVTLYNQIKANHSCTRIIYFAGWGPEGGVFSGDNTQNCIDRIYGNINYLNDNIGTEIVAPIGKAWKTSLSQMPGIDLYHADNVHPSLEGSYLAAASIFTAVFRMDPSNLTYTAGINPSIAQSLRQIAYNTVTDPVIYNETHLNIYTPVISVNGNVLASSGSASSSYQWYYNGAPVGVNSNTYTATGSGAYWVVLTSSSGCVFPSFPLDITTVGIHSENRTEEEFLFHYLTQHTYKLISSQQGQVNIYDLQGRLIKTYNKTSDDLLIKTEGIKRGLYVISLTNANYSHTHKFFVK